LKKRENFLVYLGNAGLGKTHFSAAMIEPAIMYFNSFRYWKEADLHKRVRASMTEYKGDYLETLKFLIDDDLVILDDIGSDGVNEWRKEILFEAIDQRYNSLKPTIFISNFTRKEFKEIYHARLGSRLFAKENIIIEIHDGVDHRE
jgi:DNA replication protein DnaC